MSLNYAQMSAFFVHFVHILFVFLDIPASNVIIIFLGHFFLANLHQGMAEAPQTEQVGILFGGFNKWYKDVQIQMLVARVMRRTIRYWQRRPRDSTPSPIAYHIGKRIIKNKMREFPAGRLNFYLFPLNFLPVGN
jgi:hypothetical protein